MAKRQIVAVDFDGTLSENEFPGIGAPRLKEIERIKAKKASGAYLILWTCRTGELLTEAIVWAREQGIHFDAVNENAPWMLAVFGTEGRKIFAHEYIDDRAVVTI